MPILLASSGLADRLRVSTITLPNGSGIGSAQLVQLSLPEDNEVPTTTAPNDTAAAIKLVAKSKTEPPPTIYLPPKENAQEQGPEFAVFLKNCLERMISVEEVDVPLVNWHIILARMIEYEPIRDLVYAALKEQIKPATANEAAKKLNLKPPKKKESRKTMYQNNVAYETCVKNYGRLIDVFIFLATFPKNPQMDLKKDSYVKEEKHFEQWICSRIHAIGNKAGVQFKFIRPDWINFAESPMFKQYFSISQFYRWYPGLGAELAKMVHNFVGFFPFFKVPAIDEPLTKEFMKEMKGIYQWAGLKAFDMSCDFARRMSSLKVSQIAKIKKEGENILKLKENLTSELGEMAPYARLMDHPLAAHCNTVNYPNLYKTVMLYKQNTDPKMKKFKTYFGKKTINKDIILENLVLIEKTCEKSV